MTLDQAASVAAREQLLRAVAVHEETLRHAQIGGRGDYLVAGILSRLTRAILAESGAPVVDSGPGSAFSKGWS